MDIEPWHEHLERSLQYNPAKPPAFAATCPYVDEQLRADWPFLSSFGLRDYCESSMLDASAMCPNIPAEGVVGTFSHTASTSPRTLCNAVPMLPESDVQALPSTRHFTQRQTLSTPNSTCTSCHNTEPRTPCPLRTTDHAWPLQNTLAGAESGRHRKNHSRRKAKLEQSMVFRCFDHGCDGRRFSTLGNLARHRKEQDGLSTNFRCDWCGMKFTRSTARNQHQELGKCLVQPLSWKMRPSQYAHQQITYTKGT